MNASSTIANAFVRTVEEINEQQPPGDRLEARADQLLLGPGAPLDSLGFVNFLATADRHLEASGIESPGLLERFLIHAPQQVTIGDLMERTESAGV